MLIIIVWIVNACRLRGCSCHGMRSLCSLAIAPSLYFGLLPSSPFTMKNLCHPADLPPCSTERWAYLECFPYLHYRAFYFSFAKLATLVPCKYQSFLLISAQNFKTLSAFLISLQEPDKSYEKCGFSKFSLIFLASRH